MDDTKSLDYRLGYDDGRTGKPMAKHMQNSSDYRHGWSEGDSAADEIANGPPSDE